jgi:hypothetical protein
LQFQGGQIDVNAALFSHEIQFDVRKKSIQHFLMGQWLYPYQVATNFEIALLIAVERCISLRFLPLRQHLLNSF